MARPSRRITYETFVTASRNTRRRKLETTTVSLIPLEVASLPSIACPAVMFIHGVGEKEKYVLFARTGAFVQGGTSGPSTNA